MDDYVMHYIDIYKQANASAEKRGGSYKTFRHLMQDGTCSQQFEFIEKAWGSEEIVQRHPYAIKVMRVKPNMQVSLHLHQLKQETFMLISGTLIIEAYDKAGTKRVIVLDEPFKTVTLDPMTPHTFYCRDGQIEETVFIEASSFDDPKDNYRLTQSGPRAKDITIG